MSGIGHIGIGLAAKGITPKTKLRVLLIAPMLLDVLWVILSLVGIKSNIWTHGLFMAVVWSLIATMTTGLITHKFRISIIIGLLVFSHWVVDFITHPMGFIIPKDTGIPLFLEGSPLVGLGLYNTLTGVIVGEAIMLVPGIVIYALSLRKQKKHKIHLMDYKNRHSSV